MDLKRLITQVSYRIEEKPGGGVIAYPYDQNASPLEAPTRLELNQLIQARNTEILAQEFPAFKPSAEEKEQLSFHIERRADGGFTIHSADPGLAADGVGTHQEIESHVAEKVLGFMARRMADKLPPEIAAQLSSGDIKVKIQRSVTTGGKTLSRDVVISHSGQDAAQPSNPALLSSDVTNSQAVGTFTGDSPIVPEPSRSWPIFRFLIAAIAVLVFVYIFLHRR